MTRKRFAVSFFCLGLALVSAPAYAQSANAGIASQLFDAGRDLMKKGDFVNACPKLAQSATLEPRLGTFGRLAECEEKIGHLAAARGHWNDAVDLAHAQKDDRAQHAEDELKRVDALVPRVLVTMTAPPANLSLSLDDVAIGAASIGVALPIDPGHHTITASAPDKTPWATSIETKADGATTSITIPPLTDSKPVVAPPPVVENSQPLPQAVQDPRPDPPTSRPLATVGVVTAIVGGAFIATGAVLGVVANSKASKSYDDGCSKNGMCPAGAAASEHDSARTFAGISTITFIGGGVLVAAGAVLFIVAPKKAQSSALLVGPAGIGGTW
ncbi:MAG: hypothetical protein ABI183_24055 [Polyangiaceae bacterium]